MAPDFERLALTPWPMACLASSGIRLLSSALACSWSRWADSGAGKDAGELRPGIGRRHIDDPNGLDPRFWRLDPKQARGLASLDTAPELALGGDDQVLIERIGVGS